MSVVPTTNNCQSSVDVYSLVKPRRESSECMEQLRNRNVYSRFDGASVS